MVQKLKAKYLKGTSGGILTVGSGGAPTFISNTKIFGIITNNKVDGKYKITCYGFDSNSNVYAGRVQLTNEGITGNTITAGYAEFLADGVYNLSMRDRQAGGTAILPAGITISNYYAWTRMSDISTIYRLNMSSDTQTESIRGTTYITTSEAAAIGNSVYGWFVGGYNPSFVRQSHIERLEFSTDTTNNSFRVNYPVAVNGTRSVSDTSTYGWFVGGEGNPGVSYISKILRLSFAADTTSLSERSSSGGLSTLYHSTMYNTSYGWITGGVFSESTISRLDYSADTNSLLYRTNDVLSRYSTTGLGNSTYGWILGGTSPIRSYVTRLEYSNDTISPSIKGYLVYSRRGAGEGVDNDYSGLIIGGSTPGRSSADRISFSNDTNTAVSRTLNYERLEYHCNVDNFNTK